VNEFGGIGLLKREVNGPNRVLIAFSQAAWLISSIWAIDLMMSRRVRNLLLSSFNCLKEGSSMAPWR
jgi:hypothetical protein